MITVLIGKSASGKTTIQNELVKDGYEKIVTYTTRPRRRGEKKNDTYHFITEEEFLSKIDDGFFLEWDSYDTVDGKWYYGSAAEDYTGDKIVILTPRGLNKVKKKVKDVFSIYVYTTSSELVVRLKKRGDKQKEVERRIEQDHRDFKGAEDMVDKIVYNNSDLPYTLDKIKKLIEQRKNN